MSSEAQSPSSNVSYAQAPNLALSVDGVRYAYRELGPRGDIPVVLFVHLAATLDNWDPRIVDAIAARRHVIAFDNRGVGGSSGDVPETIEAMADDAAAFIQALGHDTIDVFAFSLGGMVAQAMVLAHPTLVRRLVLTGTGPAGGNGIDKVGGTTYFDMLRAAVTLSDPKEFLFFNRDDAGKRAGRAFIERLHERKTDRDAPISIAAFQMQLRAIKRWGNAPPGDLSRITQPTLIANGDNDRMVPSVLSYDLHRRIAGSRLIIYPDSGHGAIFQFHDQFAPLAADFLNGTPERDAAQPSATAGGTSADRPAPLDAHKHFSSSILLWVRTDQPREAGMASWKGPHSKIISASKGMLEYRQIHLAADNAGLWPATPGVQTAIPPDRRVDGVAEVTFESALAPVQGLDRTRLAFKDEVNVFRRTLLYAGPPGASRWYSVANPNAPVGARAYILLRRRSDVDGQAFRDFLHGELVPSLASVAALTELRSQWFLPWSEATWATPDVAHDNPHEERFHASLILGFASARDRDAFFAGPKPKALSERLARHATAVHAYAVSEAPTFVENSKSSGEPR